MMGLTVVGCTVFLGFSHSPLSASKLGRSDDFHRLALISFAQAELGTRMLYRVYAHFCDLFNVFHRLESDKQLATSLT